MAIAPVQISDSQAIIYRIGGFVVARISRRDWALPWWI